MEKISKSLIASCGMNCGVCVAHLREKTHVLGVEKLQRIVPKLYFHVRLGFVLNVKRSIA
ncbi:MAG: hypothetical protein PHU86_01900 [Patescibacteria group bacterium]|nr:hypothetical protein [Patescibacteria group bacterium]